MNTVSVKQNWLPTGMAIALTVLVGCINLVDVRLSLLLVAGLIIMFTLYLKPPYALAALIVLAPFSETNLVSSNFAGVPGFKIINLALLAVVIVFILSKRGLRVKWPDLLFIIGTVLLLAISVFRSLPHLSILNYYLWEPMGSGKYLVSGIIKPILFLVPFIIISGYMRDRKELDFLIKCFQISIFLLSSLILLLFLFKSPDKSNFTAVRFMLGQYLGTHANGIANFYLLGYPIILAWFLYKRNIFNCINLVIALASVALLYSRTAYVLIVFSTVLLLVLDKKTKLLPVMIFLGVCATLISPETVIERGLTGIEERDMQAFSAGRVQNIWLPLLNDVKDDPKKLLVGSGRHAIIHSSSLWKGDALQRKGHAHNMYLNMLLDTGIVGLSFYLLFFYYYLKEIKKGMKDVPAGKYRTLLTGTLVSLIAYLISGLTGRNFFPEASNAYLWISLAIALNIIRMHQTERKTSYEI